MNHSRNKKFFANHLKQGYVFLQCCLKGNKCSNLCFFVLTQSLQLAYEEVLHNRAVKTSGQWWADERCKVGDKNGGRACSFPDGASMGFWTICKNVCVCVGLDIMILAFYQLEAEQLDHSIVIFSYFFDMMKND
ncbi:hypothetical protein GOODEAATRI_013087 [Goodea atripinnis]|uniref:Uncharacterized protein n=1 Tax=Goodea atripinnis TaxID=208336 RepID=A0ABV0PDV7_9TELE